MVRLHNSEAARNGRKGGIALHLSIDEQRANKEKYSNDKNNSITFATFLQQKEKQRFNSSIHAIRLMGTANISA